jgi:hypothetical protein
VENLLRLGSLTLCPHGGDLYREVDEALRSRRTKRTKSPQKLSTEAPFPEAQLQHEKCTMGLRRCHEGAMQKEAAVSSVGSFAGWDMAIFPTGEIDV